MSILSNDEQRDLAKLLFDIEVVQFGEFKLVSGITSPIYLDMKGIISYPKKLKKLIDIYVRLLEPLSYDRIAGVAYGSLPIAGALSLKLEKPWIYARKEKKKYGTGKQIEGSWAPNETLVIVDDLISKGDTKFQSIELFENKGMKVKDLIVLVDRELGGSKVLNSRGYELHSAISITEILNSLLSERLITPDQHLKVLQFMKDANANG